MCYRRAYVVKLVEIAHNMQNVCIYLRRCIHAISTIISTHKEAFLLTLLEQRHGARSATSPPTESNTGPLKLLVWPELCQRIVGTFPKYCNTFTGSNCLQTILL